jgi:hypothetical protein
MLVWMFQQCIKRVCSAPSPSLPPNFRGVRPASQRATPSVQGDSASAVAALEAATATATSAAATAAENERTLAAAEAADVEEAAGAGCYDARGSSCNTNATPMQCSGSCPGAAHVWLSSCMDSCGS